MVARARTVSSAAETRRLAHRLGRIVHPGDVIGLVGALGAGKTCFVQGLARGLGVPARERVASPTFNIVLEHTGRLPLYHVDLYRLTDRGELADLGLEQYLHGAGVAAVEWIDRFPELAPPDHLEVRFSIDGPQHRALAMTAHGPRSAALVASWFGD